jgi:protein-S-isoprenylcysteine O-methyltransferase Ste14
MKRLNWSNFPIPEGHVILLILGIALDLCLPIGLFETNPLAYMFGALLLIAGVALAVWAFVTAGEMEIEKPHMLITTGPFAFSRNPMYLGWTMTYLAAVLFVNTYWLVMFLPILLLYTHYFVIRREEQQLQLLFGEQYRQYCTRVRRYL